MVAVHDFWYCGDEYCDCTQVRITDETTGVLLAEGPYCSGGERDLTGSVQTILNFIADNPEYTHKFRVSAITLLNQVLDYW